MSIKYVVTCSGGNDSVALIEYMQQNHHGEFCVLYNDTGWARADWPARIKKISEKCFGLGIRFHITKSEGMEALVKRKKGWPMPASKMQFCTQELKEKPSLEFYDKIDPCGEIIIVTGRRREESQNRAALPLWQYESEKHGGRDVYNPIINFTESDRDKHILGFGMEPLGHSSMECYPCVCANKSDLGAIPEGDPVIEKIKQIELDMGFGVRSHKPKTMFRPYRVGGGVGIEQAIAWGRGGRGYKSAQIPDEYIYRAGRCLSSGETDLAYEPDTKEGREFAKQCDGGFCGS